MHFPIKSPHAICLNVLLLGSIFGVVSGCMIETSEPMKVEPIGDVSQAVVPCRTTLCWQHPGECAAVECSPTDCSPLFDRWRLHTYNSLNAADPPSDVHYDESAAPPDYGFKFDWGLHSPASCVDNTNFYVRILRKFAPGTYCFTLVRRENVSDDVQLLVDGVVQDQPGPAMSEYNCQLAHRTVTIPSPGAAKVRVDYRHFYRDTEAGLEMKVSAGACLPCP